MHTDKESGVLRTTVDQSRRPAAAVLLCGAVLAMPLLLIQSGADAAPPDHSGPNGHHPSADAAPGSPPSASEVALGAVHGGSSPPSASGPPVTAEPVAAAVQTQAESTLTAQNVASHVALPDQATATTTSTTTTTAPPPTTTTTAPAPPTEEGSAHRGQVTYYDHPAGRCASPTLPFGTVVRITNPANGRSVSCMVDDREADTERSIDLATSTFALIAPLSQGVIDAELSW